MKWKQVTNRFFFFSIVKHEMLFFGKKQLVHTVCKLIAPVSTLWKILNLLAITPLEICSCKNFKHHWFWDDNEERWTRKIENKFFNWILIILFFYFFMMKYLCICIKLKIPVRPRSGSESLVDDFFKHWERLIWKYNS